MNTRPSIPPNLVRCGTLATRLSSSKGRTPEEAEALDRAAAAFAHHSYQGRPPPENTMETYLNKLRNEAAAKGISETEHLQNLLASQS
jgi:hypothetical protein